MFYSPLLNTLSVFVLKYKLSPVIFWKPTYNINSAKYTERLVFRLILENFTRGQKCFTRARLVTNSRSVYKLLGLNGDHLHSHEATTRLSDRPIWIRLGGNIGIDGVCNIIRGGASKQNNRMMKVTRLVILMILKSNQRIIIKVLNQ